jgi:3-methylfumaryl-CoA hydratase
MSEAGKLAPAIDQAGIDHLRSWIGRVESADDVLTPRLANGFRATLDDKGRPAIDGDEAPVGIHWCLAPTAAPQSALGPDGHPARGDFLPPVPLERRMWAGAALTFRDSLRVGDRVQRTSTVIDVTFKEGRSGVLCFVTVEHVISTSRGQAIRERQDIVYRNGADRTKRSRSTDSRPAPPAPRWRTTILPDPVLLFRYSALTFNGHRIHYDRTYCIEEEGYPGLVVHGPLQATLLLRLAASAHAGRAPASFGFRAVRPLFDQSMLTLNAAGEPRQPAKTLQLWATDAEGDLTMTAEANW